MMDEKDTNELLLRRRVFSHSIDVERARERAEVHFNGNSSLVLDYLRLVTVFDTRQQYEKFRDKFVEMERTQRESEEPEVRGWRDRIFSPHTNGYEDYKVLLEMSSPQPFIYTSRFVSAKMLQRQYEVLPVEKYMLHWFAKMRVPRNSHFVVVQDNFNWNDERSTMLISGFPTDDDAMEYMQLRMSDCLQQFRKLVICADELRTIWTLFGDCLVYGGINTRGELVKASPNLYGSILECGSDLSRTDWVKFASQFDLKYESIPHPSEDFAADVIY
jgi:hypothetical protein